MNTSKLINVWTIQLSNWRLAKKLNITIIDITARSGIELFAPDFSLVMQYKNGLLNESDYTDNYINKMRYSLTRYPSVWEELLEYNTFAFACYCKPNVFCHRLIMTSLFEKYAASKGYTIIKHGELIKSVNN